MLSWAVCISVSAQGATSTDGGSNTPAMVATVPTPIVQVNQMQCDGSLYFTVSNYDTSLGYDWSLNTGMGSADANGVYTVSYPQDGVNYELTVKAYDVANPTVSATTTVSRYYVKTPNIPQISYTHDCGDPITFKLDNNTYPSNYSQKWMLDGVAVNATAGQYSFSNFRDGDSFTMSIVVTNTVNGYTCTSQASETVQAKVVPNSPRVSVYDACEIAGTGYWEDLVTKSKSTYTLNWYSEESQITSPYPLVPAPDEFAKDAVGENSYWVTQVSDISGCESSDRTQVKVNVRKVPVAFAGDDLTICEGESAVLADGLVEDQYEVYTWSPSGKLLSTNTYTVTTRPLSVDTEFKLKVANKNATNCFSEDYVKVKVLKKPQIQLSQTKFTICEDGSVSISNLKADPTKESYLWETITNGVSDYAGGDKDITLSSLSETTKVILTSTLDDLSSCYASDEANITVIPRPTANVGDPIRYVCYGTTIQIGATGENSVKYQWTPTTGLSNPTVPNPFVSNVTSDITYTLVATAASTAVTNCSSDPASVQIVKVDKPTKYTLSGGGTYCQSSPASGIILTLDGSDSNTEYCLEKDGNLLNDWRPGVDGPLQWFDVEAGNYTVKARKAGYDTCMETMLGTAVVQAVSSPNVRLRLASSPIACPGDEVTVRIEITGGAAPYKLTLLTNGVPEVIENINSKYYDFQYQANGATTFQVSEVSDSYCRRVYLSTDYPELELKMANEEDFNITASKANPVCFGDKVTLSVRYNEPGAIFIWESGVGGNSITVDATLDHTYLLQVETPEGCKIPREYTLDVVEKVPVTISGFTKKDNFGVHFLCSDDDPVLAVATPTGGVFTSTPAGLINGSVFDPSKVKDLTTYEIKYEYRDVASGCKFDTIFDFNVSAINKTVNWTMAPTNLEPSQWPEHFEKCQPDAANPKDVIELKGEPQVPGGTWSVHGELGITTGASIVKTNDALAEAKIINVTAGEKYFISYSVTDQYGCTGISTKDLIVKSKSTSNIESGGLLVYPSENICINETSATIKSLQNPGTFSLATKDAAMYVGDTADGMGIEIDPSKGKIGSHTVIYTAEDMHGCKKSEKVYFNIVNPVKITAFELPKKEFCEKEEPVVITVSASVPTTGYIRIVDQNGVEALSRTNIEDNPKFDPEVPGEYTISYHYNDGTCEDVYSEKVIVHPLPVIDFLMKDDYCYGEKISIVPNYAGGTTTLNPDTKQKLIDAGHTNIDEIIKGNIFYTEESGKGKFTIDYEVADTHGCVATASKEFQVRGVENMSIAMDTIFCSPTGVHPVVGFPKPFNAQDQVYFTTDQHIALTDNTDGTAAIDLKNTTYNTIYPITYHYVEAYADAAGNPQTCETTVTQDFKVLDQTADFSGYADGATICSDVLRIELHPNLKENTIFEFSHAAQYPDAFEITADSIAILYPSLLPEGVYQGVTMTHKYYDEAGKKICESKITKSFKISKIEEVKDIELFCDANKTAVRLKNTEVGIRYDLYVNNAVYDSHKVENLGEVVNFKPIDVPSSAFVTVYLMAVEPDADHCSLKLSKEYTISPLQASVVSTNISCYDAGDGKFEGTAQGGIGKYVHQLFDDDGNLVIQADASIGLGVDKYKYVVTDSIGCNYEVPFEITQPNALDFQIQQTDVKCHGNKDAEVKAQVLSNAGMAPYTYEWIKKDPDLGEVFVSSEPAIVADNGEYKITVTDAHNCWLTKDVTISAPSEPLSIELESKEDVAIRGNATGKISVNVSGGTPGYTYKWSGKSINTTNLNQEDLEDIEELESWVYSLEVTDARGCKANLSVNISQPESIKIDKVVQNVKCFGENNGVISLTISGGAPYSGSTPYNVKWYDEAGTEIGQGTEIDNLVAGKYKYIITDKEGDTREGEVEVEENPELTVTTSLQSVLSNKCYGDENGKIIIKIDGGTGIYEDINWIGLDPSHLVSDKEAINLGKNTYQIDVTDTNGCNVSHTVDVTEPAMPLGLKSENIVQNICHNASNGEIQIEMQGGTGNYTYIWQGAGVNPSAQNQICLTAGEEYSVRVYDDNLCMWENTYTMDNPKELTLSLTSTDIKCKGAKNGKIEAVVTGEEKFTYSWAGPNPAVTFDDVPSIHCEEKGMYMLTVTDKLGCSITDGVEISEPTEVKGRVVSTHISCNNANDGSVIVYAEGGTGVYTYELINVTDGSIVSTNYEESGLKGGYYQYKVNDSNSCSWVSPVIYINNPDIITITPLVSDVTINGLVNGVIDLGITGGTPDAAGLYNIQWNSGPSIVDDPADPAYNANKQILTGLKAGYYSVIVTDARTCATSMQIEVTQPEIIKLDIKVDDVGCYGENSGKITVSNIQGGAGDYTITWYDQNSVEVARDIRYISGLIAGTYKLVVKDKAGATFEKDIIVTEPDEIKITTVPTRSKLSVDCFGNATGSITIEITGGTLPYEYDWIGTPDIYHNQEVVENLGTGTYSILLKDANGCSNNTYQQTIQGPVGKLAISENIIQNKCYGESNASIEINVTGGTAPYAYLWTGAGIDASNVTNQNQYNLYNNQTYKVTVIDALNCTQDAVYTMDQRIEMLVATSHKDVPCHNLQKGELSATISGGTGDVSYKWEKSDGTYTSSVLEIKELYAGEYTFTAVDEAGCTITRLEEIKQPDQLIAEISGDKALCGGIDDGQLYVAVTGGTLPYSYEWHKDFDDVNPIGYGAHLTNLGKGEYEIFIKDKNLCEAYDKTSIEASVPMTITLVDKKDVTIYGEDDGLLKIQADGGSGTLIYSWSGPSIDPNTPASGPLIEDLVAGYYNVTVEDAVGCKISERYEITQPETIKIFADITDIYCAGDEGKILLRVSGGTAPYTFDWTGPNGYTNTTQDPEIVGLKPGIYYVTITDFRGAQTTPPRQYDIAYKAPLEWKLLTSKTTLDCYNENDANINIHVEGGTYPYSIKWTGPNFTANDVQSIGNLGIGTYKAEITDANGCKPTDIFVQEITQPEEIKITEVITHNNCSSDKNGAIDITVEGGVPQYSFAWSGFNVVSDSEDQTDLPEGTYYLNFTDGNGCQVNKEYKVNANNEISAIISGPSNICSAEEFNIQIDVNGLASWAIEYTDGTQIYTKTTDQNSNVYPHSLLSDAEFKLIKVVDANGCEAKLGEGVKVDVHELPQITIVSAQEDCCLGEPALIDIIFAGKGPWTINYTDGTLDYVDGPFTADRDYLKITPTQVGTKTYTIKSVSNENCTVPVDYSVDITAYTYPNLEVNISPYICEPNPLQVSLHATGEAPWHLVYYINDLKYEYDMQVEDEVIEYYPNKPENVFLFETIKSGKRCVTQLDKTMQSQMGLLPEDAQSILGSNMVCRGSIASFSTLDIPYATSYKWSLPEGFNIVSGLDSKSIEVQVSEIAKDGEVRVWGVNDCGEGIYTAINVQVDKPMSVGAEITMPPFVCDNESLFPLSVAEVENATNYEWIMPTGYTVVSGQGTRSVMVQIDKYALSNTVQVIPSNICTEADPIKANIIIRSLPLSEAGVDFITNCSDEALLHGFDNPHAVSSQWKLVSGNAEFQDPSHHNTMVSDLMYGDNVLAWTVDDGYCIGYDLVTVTNQNPGITEPEFSELTICEDYMTLRAGKPEFGMGRWTLIAGDGEIENPNSHETKITGLSNKRTNVIRWEVYSPQCSNSVNVEIISHDLSKLVDAGADGVSTTGSYRLSARVVNDADVTGTWTVEAGEGVIEDPHNPNTVVTGLATGINTIRWTLRGYDCEAYDEIKVRLVDEPIASFNIETTEGCVPLTVHFTNTTIGNADYKWEFGDGSSSDLRSPVHIFENPGTYTVKLTASANGRVDTFTGEVKVLPSPEAAFSVAERQLYVPNAEAHFYSETDNGVNHYWLFGDGGSSDKANPVYTYVEDGLYDVTYIVSDINLCSDTLVMEKFIKVGKDSYLVFPTAFTPNVEKSNGGLYSEGERRLDIFYPIGRNVDIYKLEIFSSWGNKVFESNDQYVGWDGYYMGQCAAQGVYLYRAEGRYKDGNAFQYSGNLMLIR